MALPTLTSGYTDGFRIPYTPGTAQVAGAVINAGKGLIGFLDQDRSANQIASLDIHSARRCKKATSVVTFAVGDEVILDVANGLAVSLALSLAGDAHIPLGVCCKAAAAGDDHVCFIPYARTKDRFTVLQPFVYEFDFETTGGTGTGVKTLLPGWMNRHGLIYYDAFGIVTEQFGGASQDQGILTLKDTAGTPNTLGTITPADAGADAVGDILRSTNLCVGASNGAAIKTIAAGDGITGTITQQTAGASEGGKYKVYLHCIPLL